jgi:hypothetical protein
MARAYRPPVAETGLNSSSLVCPFKRRRIRYRFMREFRRNAMKKGGEHELAAAAFRFGRDSGGSSCDSRLGTNGGSRVRAGRRHFATSPVDSEFFDHMDAPVPPRLRAAAVRSRPGEKHAAPSGRRWQPIAVGGRLHQSDLETPGGRGSEESSRNRVARRRLSPRATSVGPAECPLFSRTWACR